ncbi:MAG: FAD:protein FMN transferase [Bacteroidota bacterium]
MKKILLLFLAISFVACQNSTHKKVQVFSGEALGTTFQVQFFNDEMIDLSTKIDSTFQTINQSLSTYISTSDISKINKGDSTIQVDHQFVDNFKTAKHIHKQTQGYFDPTVGVLVNAYGFGPENTVNEISQHSLDSLRNLVGFDKVSMAADRTIKKEHPSIFIDFNAIAKGYAVDRLAQLLENHQIDNYLVEIGGELVASGENLDNQQPWKIGIDDPVENNSSRSYSYIVALNNQAMATSGNYRKFKTDSAGNKFVHTVNPITGKNTKSDVLSATVLADDCMIADAYATAFMAMGFEKSVKLLQEIGGVQAMLIYAEEGNVNTYFTTDFEYESVN